MVTQQFVENDEKGRSRRVLFDQLAGGTEEKSICVSRPRVDTAQVFRRDSPGKAAQWMGRSIHES
jgi:hypothetical protein